MKKIADNITMEQGKTLPDAEGDVSRGFQMFPIVFATGNTMVLKPSEQDPGACMMLVELVKEVGIPDGCVNVIHGQHEAVNFICDNPDIHAISFVGADQALHLALQDNAVWRFRPPILVGEARSWLPEIVEKAKSLKEGDNVVLDGSDIVVPGFENGNFVGTTIISGVKNEYDVLQGVFPNF
ncbi:Methylmalonate-semialdehyde dehydrogenase [acylating] mitochondrial [Parelaphostrongylus tenuis]|uniref:Probable methylmalonate-semialdehyde/malonate-semialdehyde dehydrogenase [acylating], mitochondrial n=1 Tax=Parelaphostrongylus tenuis TaxID=148309 RepID=A0AAD5R0M9_PARTN|nr:Methylmalonate-semialdehyde dehydrogenase [acylating] mitochondrial [Parelaphostrongylus tenuis]